MKRSAFKRAEELGAEVLLWGKTQKPHVEIVLLRYPRSGFRVCCFDNGTGDFFNDVPCQHYDPCEELFVTMLHGQGACDDPHG